MVSLTCTTDHRDGATLVTARLEGAQTPQRVALENRLDGPVWPPRRQGIPEAGWDEDRFETVVPADETVGVGYAAPAPPADSPLAIVEREIVDAVDQREPATPGDALRDLGDPSPPRDAVPIPVGESPAPPAGSDQTSTRDPVRSSTRRRDAEVPAAVVAWLDTLDERVAAAERLAAAETLPEATDAMRTVGSLDETEALVDSLQEDADALESVARRADRLAERSAAADVPMTAFERLA